MQTLKRLLAVVAVSGIGLAGCDSGGMTSPDANKDSGTGSVSALVGPTWHVVTIDGAKVLDGTQLTATFSTDSRVSGSSGCNLYSGRAEAQTGRLAIGSLASTLMACQADGVMSQERRYLAALQAATSFSVSGDELRLGRSASEVTLVYSSK
jgi:heat shock protein HslJ